MQPYHSRNPRNPRPRNPRPRNPRPRNSRSGNPRSRSRQAKEHEEWRFISEFVNYIPLFEW